MILFVLEIKVSKIDVRQVSSLSYLEQEVGYLESYNLLFLKIGYKFYKMTDSYKFKFLSKQKTIEIEQKIVKI